MQELSEDVASMAFSRDFSSLLLVRMPLLEMDYLLKLCNGSFSRKRSREGEEREADIYRDFKLAEMMKKSKEEIVHIKKGKG